MLRTLRRTCFRQAAEVMMASGAVRDLNKESFWPTTVQVQGGSVLTVRA
jgi:hypothetical protein